MRSNYKTYLSACMLCLALLTGCSGNNTAEEPDGNTARETESSSGEQNGGDAITFDAQTMDQTSVSAELFSRSRITMVNVWATYCNPCLSEMPGLGALAAAYDPEDFQLIGIISDVREDSDEAVLQQAADLIEETGADYPHLLLNESLYKALLTEVSAVPTTFFVSQEGQILDTVVGAMEQSAWEEKVNALLEE